MNEIIKQTEAIMPLSAERKSELEKLTQQWQEKLEAYVAEAMNAVCKSEEDAQRLQAILKACKDEAAAIEKNLVECETAKKLHKLWVQFRDTWLEQYDNAARIIRQKIVAWQEEERRKAEEERRRLQAIEEEKARKEREALLKKAEKIKSEERKQALLEQAETITPVKVVVDVPKKTIITRKEWRVGNVDKKKLIDLAAQNYGIYGGYLDVNTTALRKAKQANKELMIEGVEFVEVII